MSKKRTYFVKAIWDKEAKVFYSESDIIGFHVEAETVEEFEALIYSEALDLVIANHITKRDLERKSLVDLIPAIVWQRPELTASAA